MRNRFTFTQKVLTASSNVKVRFLVLDKMRAANICVAFGLFVLSLNVNGGLGANLAEVVLEANEAIDEKAAPWWEQQEEAARAKCKSSCTAHSKGVKTQLSLCDDSEVRLTHFFHIIC